MLRLKVGSRGFNLFSAIVAAVLFMAGVMLVQTMVATEDKISGQIFSMEENFALSDAANLARSDSLQTFNYHFRAKLEDYLTNTDNEFPILYRNLDGESNYNNPDSDWDDVVDEFEKQILLTGSSSASATTDIDGDVRTTGNEFKAVLRFVSEKMIDEFQPGAYGRYDVALDVTNTNEAITITSDTLARAIEAADDMGEDFLEVLDCDRDKFSGCPQGTFYFNIPLDKIDDADYEKLPRIIVKDLITGEEIKIAILPKSNLRVYIPLRFFKAAHEALIRYSSAVKDNHNLFAGDYHLGYCDSGCNVRTSPTSKANGNRSADCDEQMEILSGSPAGVSKYITTGLSTTGSLGLRASAIQEICESASGASYSTDDTFINVDLEGDDYEPGLESNGVDIQHEILDCPFSKIKIGTGTFKTKEIIVSTGSTSNPTLYCGEIISVEVVLEFRETNTKYIVKGTENRYKIKIVDEDFERNSDESEDCKTGGTKCCVPGTAGCPP